MIYKIKILNWETYNGRRDVKKRYWIRLQTDLFVHPHFLDFTDAEYVAWLYLLFCASRAGSGEFEIEIDETRTQSRRLMPSTEPALLSVIQKLRRRRILDVRDQFGRHVNVTPRYDTIRNEYMNLNTTYSDSITTAVEKNEVEKTQSNLPVLQRKPVTAAFVSPDSIEDLLKIIPEKTMKTWISLYDDQDFIRRELIKALAYYQTNTRKTPKTNRGWFNALASWLDRAWTWRAKTTQGVKPDSSFDIRSTMKDVTKK